MLKRAIRQAPVRFNYYNKYGVRRGASDDEIKKAINAHTSRTLMGMGVGVPNKKKAAMLGVFAARDQWAKFVLLKKKDAYHIWLDEPKAIGHAINENRKTIKMEDATPPPPPKETYGGPSVEELNRQMAVRQRNQTADEKKQKFAEKKELPEGPEVIEIKKKQFFSSDDKKAIASVVAPILTFFSWRHPAVMRVLIVPVAALLYVTIEMNRGKSKTAELHAGEESLSFRRRYDD